MLHECPLKLNVAAMRTTTVYVCKCTCVSVFMHSCMLHEYVRCYLAYLHKSSNKCDAFHACIHNAWISVCFKRTYCNSFHTLHECVYVHTMQACGPKSPFVSTTLITTSCCNVSCDSTCTYTFIHTHIRNMQACGRNFPFASTTLITTFCCNVSCSGTCMPAWFGRKCVHDP